MSKTGNLTNLKTWIVQHKWWVSAVSALVLLLIVVTALPAIISSQFQKWVLANGADQVSVENVDFNPFTARLGLYNILIEKDGQQPFLLPSLEMHARWRDLFQRRFVIRSLGVTGVRLTVDQSLSEDSHVGGILLRRLVSDSTATEASTAKPWHFRIESLALSDVAVDYRLQGLQSNLQVDSLSLNNLDSLPDAGPASINLQGSLDGAPVTVTGEAAPFSVSPGFAGKLVIEMLPVGPYLQLADKAFAENTATVAVDSQIQISITDAGLTLEQDGQAGLSALSWQLPEQLLKAARLQWRGALNLQRQNDGGMKLLADGSLDSADLLLDGAEQPVTLQNERLVWQGRLETTIDAQQQISNRLDGQLQNTGLDLDLAGPGDNAMHLKNADFNWQGNAAVDLANSELSVDAQGKLQNEGMLLELEQQQLQLEAEALAWQGDFDMQQAGEALQLSSSGNARINGLLAQTLDKAQRVLRAQQISAETLEVNALDAINIKRLALSGLSVGNPVEGENLPTGLNGFINYEKLLLEPLAFDGDSGLTIGNIQQDGVNHVVVRNADGSWAFDSLIGALKRMAGPVPPAAESADAGAQDTTASEAESDGLPVKIGNISMSPGARLFYQDRSLHRPFAKAIEINTFSLGELDSTKPLQASPVKLEANIDKAQFDFNGEIAVFAAQPTFDINGEIQALSLLPFSLFMEKAFGYEVDSGSLNATASFTGKDGKLDSNTELNMNQLHIKPLSEAELKAIDAQLNGGLETGLSMLKDKNESIKLKVPVTGEFANLTVDPSDIINQAMGKALKKGAKTYFAAALFPFGTLLVVADAAAGSAMQVKLDPVFFETADTQLSEEMHPYLEKVAGVLDEKPEIFVKVCGVAVTQDREQIVAGMKAAFMASQPPTPKTSDDKSSRAEDTDNADKPAEPAFVPDEAEVKKQLTVLAEQRANSVTDFLLKAQDVEPKRLVNCQPRIETDDTESKPRADLLL